MMKTFFCAANRNGFGMDCNKPKNIILQNWNPCVKSVENLRNTKIEISKKMFSNFNAFVAKIVRI